MLHVETTGRGPPVLLLHEGIADGRMWEPQVEALSHHYRVLVPDLRGFGRSPLPPEPYRHVDDVLASLDRLGVAQVAAVGASLGARVALELALIAPQRVRALVLIAPGLSGAEWSDGVRASWAAEEAALDAGDIDQAVEINLRVWVDGPHRHPDDVDPLVRSAVGVMQRRAFEIQVPAYADPVREPTEEALDPPAIARLRKIEVPTLIVAGDLDQPDILAIADRAAAEIRNARKVVIPGTAHVPNLERPDQVSELLLEFLTQSDRVIA